MVCVLEFLFRYSLGTGLVWYSLGTIWLGTVLVQFGYSLGTVKYNDCAGLVDVYDGV